MPVRLQSQKVNRNAKIAKDKQFVKETFPFPIVGIGASAGGLEALISFFDKFPDDSGMAFVIVQHLDPTHKSLLSELIGRHTNMKVYQITNSMKVEPNIVYVIPPKYGLEIKNGYFYLSLSNEKRGRRRPIDHFLSSLAKYRKEYAVGVILSGTGTEGAIGMSDIKANGGITLVQDPATAQFAGMPEYSISISKPDHILAPEEMYKVLFKNSLKNKRNENKHLSGFSISDQHLEHIMQIIKRKTGHNFSNYKPNTIFRRLIKRISFTKSESVDAYVKLLENEADEATFLYNEFLIGVTSFFRDKPMYDYLEKNVLADLIQNCLQRKEIRIWVCGCATGEEVYSYAIMIKETIEKESLSMNVVIFASDIDQEAITIARKGVYPENILNVISQKRITRFFDKVGSEYQVCKEIRAMVIFANHNVINDPPFSKMDLISCRNLLIYMNNDLQRKVIQNFYYSLQNDGILILGSSESIGSSGDQFLALDAKFRIFRKMNGLPRRSNPNYELNFFKHKHDSAESESISGIMKKTDISSSTIKLLLDQYAPPSVIIDKYNQILYFTGNTGQFLEPAIGVAKFDILEMARKGLRPGLEEGIRKARKSNAEVYTKNIEIFFIEDFKTIRLKVVPLVSKEFEPGSLMVVFEPVEIVAKRKKAGSPNSSEKERQRISLLEKELKMTSQHLQIAINELATSREDFNRSTEELQSSNEEIETSREELQAVNEEMITVNAELTVKIEQLSQSNNDLTNLLNCIEVATIYLDKNLLIKRYTPFAIKIFNIIPTDIDRPLSQLSSNLEYNTLEDDTRTVLKTLQVKSLQVITTDGIWYYTRIIPYRTSENSIEGVLITLVDITSQKMKELELKRSNEQLSLIMENLSVVPFSVMLRPQINIEFMGKSAERVSGFQSEKFIGNFSFWAGRIHPVDKKKTLSMFSNRTASKNRSHIFKWKCADRKYRDFMLSNQYIPKTENTPAYLVCVWQIMPIAT